MASSSYPASQAFGLGRALSHLHSGFPELLVSRQPPHLIAHATPAWLDRSGYTEAEIVGRSVTCLQGSGTCLVTAGALWTALQVNL